MKPLAVLRHQLRFRMQQAAAPLPAAHRRPRPTRDSPRGPAARWLSRAEPCRTEPSRAESSRAGSALRGAGCAPTCGFGDRAPCRAEPCRTEPCRAEPSRAVPSPTRRPRPFPGRTAPSGTGTASSPPRRCAGIGGGQRAAPGGRTAPGPWGAVREGMRPRGPGGEAEHRRRGQHAAPAASAVFRSPSRAILLGRDAPCPGCVPVTQPCLSPAPDSNAQTLCAATVPPREVPKSPTQPLSGISMQSKRTTVLPSVRCLGLTESWNGLYRRGP